MPSTSAAGPASASTSPAAPRPAARSAPAAPTANLSFDPVAFLLVGYGRISPWSAIVRGRALAYGRRPWLGFRFKELFHDP